jgi:2-phosphosulfolactate phosphatase
MTQVKPLVHCEWGQKGIESLIDRTDVFIVIDVLCFTTCVDVAAARGALVYPYVWNDPSTADFVEKTGAVMANSTRKEGFSLSPASLISIPAGTKLVLPSPNGSTLSRMTGDVPTLAGCLRNSRAVAVAARKLGRRISVIAGGERWKDSTLRVSIEDGLAAGAIISELGGENSPEAELARLAFEAAKERLDWFLENSLSGLELIERNRREDIRLAGQLNVSTCAPILREGAYVPF